MVEYHAFTVRAKSGDFIYSVNVMIDMNHRMTDADRDAIVAAARRIISGDDLDFELLSIEELPHCAVIALPYPALINAELCARCAQEGKKDPSFCPHCPHFIKAKVDNVYLIDPFA